MGVEGPLCVRYLDLRVFILQSNFAHGLKYLHPWPFLDTQVPQPSVVRRHYRHVCGESGDLQGLRDFYKEYEFPLVPKTQETRELEAAENRVYDPHLEAMNTLKSEHMTHVAVIEAEFVEELAEADRKFQRLLRKWKAKGFAEVHRGLVPWAPKRLLQRPSISSKIS